MQWGVVTLLWELRHLQQRSKYEKITDAKYFCLLTVGAAAGSEHRNSQGVEQVIEECEQCFQHCNSALKGTDARLTVSKKSIRWKSLDWKV